MSDWQTKRLGDVLQLNYGKSLPVKSRVEGQIPVYGSNGVVGSHTDAIVDAPGLIVGRKGSAGQVHFSRGPFCPIDTTFYVTANDAPDTDLEFLFYLLQHINLQRIIGDVGVPGLNREMAYIEQVHFPATRPEQKKIAHVLSTVQRAIEAHERLIQTTTELKKTLMHKLFTEGTRGEPQKQTEIGLVPESWEVDRFDAFCILQRGFDITKKQQRPGKIPVVSSGGITSYHNEAKVKGPGVMIGRKGSLGTVHYIPTDYWPHDTTLWVKDFKGHDPRFTSYLLETLDLKRFDTGAANPTLNRNIVHGEKIAFPPEDQQKEIGSVLQSCEDKILVHERQKHSFEDLFRTLLHELMTAEVRVREIEIT